MKKNLIRIIVALLCVAFLAAPAMAFNASDHVYVAPNHKGDLLIYPAYFAGEGIETNFAVINTSHTSSVVAKVVVRSHFYSVEVLDFLIFLSPNDEFKATIKYENGKYWLVSTDDSLCTGTAVSNYTCASADSPKKFELYTPDCDDPSYGYIDVVEAWSGLVTNDCCQPVNGCTPPTDGTILKKCVIARYFGPWNDGEGTSDVLTGFGEINLPGKYATYMPTVLANWKTTSRLDVGTLTSPFLFSDNSICEMEAALSKNNLVVPYYDDGKQVTVPILTFPTKEAQCPIADDPNDADDRPEYHTKTSSPYFLQNGDVAGDHYMRVNYGLSIYDMMEHTVHGGCPVSPCTHEHIYLPEEVNLFAVSSPFDEGWAEIDIADGTSCLSGSLDPMTFEGAPVIGLTVEFTNNGLSILQPAYDFGKVSYDDATGVNFSGGCNCFQRCSSCTNCNP